MRRLLADRPGQKGSAMMNVVVSRRLERWPDVGSRAAAARMLEGGSTLGEVLQRYPHGVADEYKGKPVAPARRAIYAHYALMQEMHGRPDLDPADTAGVAQAIREQGFKWACIRTGSALTRYRNEWPNLTWYRSQAPAQWTTEYENLRRTLDG
jgi:hypothetical protein